MSWQGQGAQPGRSPVRKGLLPRTSSFSLRGHWGRRLFLENSVALNSGPRWLVWLPSPCVKQLCLHETRYHTRGAGGSHSSLGWKPKPSGCVYDRQHLREVILTLGETGADWVPSMKLLQGGEGFEPCSVLLGVKTASLFMGLSVAGRVTATS